MTAPARAPLSVERNSLLADLEAAQRLRSEISASDPLSRLMLDSRISEIESELSQIAHSPTTVANAAILFYGDPVVGSRSIQAEFAGKMILKIQDLVSKLAASNITALGSRGPVPGFQDTKLQLTGLAFGSFGFVFEEKDAASPEFFDSPMKAALEKTFEIVFDFSSGDDERFRNAITEIEPRVFMTLKDFISDLYTQNAQFRVVEDTKTLEFDVGKISLAHKRLQDSNISESDYKAHGVLIGLIPIGRRFEFKIDDTGEIISGSVGPRLSQDYLERLEREQLVGKPATATLTRKIVTNVGAEPTVSYRLIDLAI